MPFFGIVYPWCFASKLELPVQMNIMSIATPLFRLRNMRDVFLLCSIVLLSNLVFAQQPQYVMPSPQANSFLKYRDYPVNFSTGLVDISVPLLTLDLKSYKLPVTARFHASGRKVDMSYSELGMNWKLEAFGMITREVRGRSDFILDELHNSALMEKTADYLNTISSDQSVGDRFIKYERRLRMEGASPAYGMSDDSEYDIFTISFKDISASFIMREGQNALFLDYFPFRVQFSNNVFTITDDKGVQYVFGKIVENSSTYGSTLDYSIDTQISGPMNWYLAKIITPEQDVLRFKYATRGSDGFFIGGNISYDAKATLGDDTYQIGHDQGENLPGTLAGVLGYKWENTYSNERNPVINLTDVECSNGKLSFEYNTPYYSLNEVVLKSSEGDVLQKVKFSYQDVIGVGYTIPNNQGHSIKDISFVDSNNPQSFHQYKMEYYDGAVNAKDIAAYCYGRDYWGYANPNVYSNNIPISQVVERLGTDGKSWLNYNRTIGDPLRRSPDYFTKRIGMLRKIFYPTGGYSEFIYESNRYKLSNGQSEEGPGLRICEVRHSDGNKYTRKIYKYGNNEDGIGWLWRKPDPRDYQITQFITHIPSQNGISYDALHLPYIENAYRYRNREFYSEPVGYIRPAYNLPVNYETITEYESDENGNKLGKNVYYYSIPQYETNVKEFYDSHSNDYFTISKFVPHYYSKSTLLSKTIFSFLNNSYNEIKKTTYTYSKRREIKVPQATYFRRHKVVSYRSNGNSNIDEEIIETGEPSSHGNLTDIRIPFGTIGIRDYQLVSAVFLVDSIVESDYTAIEPVMSSSVFSYQSQYTSSPSSVVIRDSKGNKNITKYYYPDDIISDQSLPGGNLTSEEYLGIQAIKKTSGNFASIPVQTDRYINNVLFESKRSGFRLFNNKPHLYKKQNRFRSSNDFLTDYEILAFGDLANPLEIKSKSKAPTSYIWNNNAQYTIAKADNANSGDIAFTGFEFG
ncbi:hypothetical protein, partial [Pararcticibacter amylolyticus]|uniref:hypothetical protein n=1 Tax=Pararcticibacter amylolyticus TaxID=2173175 RepID=UPI001304DAA8